MSIFCLLCLLGAAIGFDVTDLGAIHEPASVIFSLSGNGFSYGNIPVQVTPLPCSDYPGNLSALFSDIPAASASLGAVYNIMFAVISNVVFVTSPKTSGCNAFFSFFR